MRESVCVFTFLHIYVKKQWGNICFTSQVTGEFRYDLGEFRDDFFQLALVGKLRFWAPCAHHSHVVSCRQVYQQKIFGT